MTKFNRNYDVHYLCCYNKDGTKYYADKHLPKSFKHKGKTISIDKYLLVHEIVEKSLEDKLGFKYEQAHEIATAAERCRVEQDGDVDWKTYDAFMQKWIKENEHEHHKDMPDDLEDPETKSYIKDEKKEGSMNFNYYKAKQLYSQGRYKAAIKYAQTAAQQSQAATPPTPPADQAPPATPAAAPAAQQSSPTPAQQPTATGPQTWNDIQQWWSGLVQSNPKLAQQVVDGFDKMKSELKKKT